MSHIRSRDTGPELAMRRLLHQAGFRYTVAGKMNRLLPGHPDIVLPRYKTVVFVHGCFWHRHAGCRYAYNPKSGSDFWQKKFSVNVQRDALVGEALRSLGWRVLVVWECEIEKDPAGVLTHFKEFLFSGDQSHSDAPLQDDHPE